MKIVHITAIFWNKLARNKQQLGDIPTLRPDIGDAYMEDADKYIYYILNSSNA